MQEIVSAAQVDREVGRGLNWNVHVNYHSSLEAACPG